MLRPPAYKNIEREVVLSIEFLGSFYFGRDFSHTKYRNNNFSVKSRRRWIMCESGLTFNNKRFFLNSVKWCLLSTKFHSWVLTLKLRNIRFYECDSAAVIGLLLAVLTSVDAISEWYESKKIFYVK